MSANCRRCTQLWQAYTEATERQVQLMQKMLVLRGDFERMQTLERDVEAAAQAREQAWERIQEHERKEHAGRPR